MVPFGCLSLFLGGTFSLSKNTLGGKSPLQTLMIHIFDSVTSQPTQARYPSQGWISPFNQISRSNRRASNEAAPPASGQPGNAPPQGQPGVAQPQGQPGVAQPQGQPGNASQQGQPGNTPPQGQPGNTPPGQWQPGTEF